MTGTNEVRVTETLIIGGDSMLGGALERHLRVQGDAVSSTSRRPESKSVYFLDLLTLEGLEGLPRARNIVIIAAEPRMAACAADPAKTGRINVEAPAKIAEWGARTGSRLIFFSSIAVHEGTVETADENSPVSPPTAYGRQKLEAEQRLTEIDSGAVLIRPAKIIDNQFALFSGFLDDLAQGREITPFSDMIVAPVHIDLVVEMTALLLRQAEARGVFQISASTQTTYEEIAYSLAATFNFPRDLIAPCRAEEKLDRASLWLPNWASVGCSRLESLAGKPMPGWQDAVDRFAQARNV